MRMQKRDSGEVVKLLPIMHVADVLARSNGNQWAITTCTGGHNHQQYSAILSNN